MLPCLASLCAPPPPPPTLSAASVTACVPCAACFLQRPVLHVTLPAHHRHLLLSPAG
jgi:hypothetical protein